MQTRVREKHVMTNDLSKMEDALHLHGLQPRTADLYLGCARRFARWAGAAPSELGAEEVRRFLVHLVRDRGLSPSTRAQYLAALRFLYEVTLERPEVTARLPRPRVIQAPRTLLSRDEVAAIVAAAADNRCRVAILAGYTTGLRVSEVAELRTEDIDCGRRSLLVRRGKGGYGRLVMVTPTLVEALELYLAEGRPGPWLFPGRSALRPVHTRTLNRYLAAAVDHAGIRRSGITYHSLRHAFATHLLDDGVSVRAIQTLLGHRRLETTASYLQISQAHLDGLRPSLARLALLKNPLPPSSPELS